MHAFEWFTELTTRERRTLYAGFGGYAVDAFDFMIYSFLIPTLIVAWGMRKSRFLARHLFVMQNISNSSSCRYSQ
jgi:hypothetical protein